MEQIIFDWKFHQLEVLYDATLTDNVVKIAHWQYSAILPYISGSLTTSMYGSTSFPEPTLTAFISYPLLTKQDVASWTETVLGPEYMTYLQNDLSGSISTLVSLEQPIPMTPPWE